MYILTYIFFLLSSWFENFELKKASRLLLVFLAIFLIIHDGIRWEIGTDWENYNKYFISCLDVDSNTFSFSLGYVALNVFIRIFTDIYTIFLFFYATLIYAILTYSLIKLSPRPIFTLFLFYGMMLPYMGMNRQLIALVVCLSSLIFLIENKRKLFYLLIAIACLFHISAMFFSVAPLLTKKIKVMYLLTALSFITLLSALNLINKLPLDLVYLYASDDPMSALNKIRFYAENNFLSTNFLTTILALGKRLIWIIVGYYIIKNSKKCDDKFILYFNLYFLGTLIYLLFNNTVLQIVVAREIIYFNIFEIFIITYSLYLLKENFFKSFYIILIAAYSYLGVEKGFNFYKEDLGIDIFRPYKSILSN